MLKSHDLHNPRSCDLSAPEYLKYSQKMHGTVKISYRFLVFWNLQNILNFPQLFLGYFRIEYNWLFPVSCVIDAFLNQALLNNMLYSVFHIATIIDSEASLSHISDVCTVSLRHVLLAETDVSEVKFRVSRVLTFSSPKLPVSSMTKWGKLFLFNLQEAVFIASI